MGPYTPNLWQGCGVWGTHSIPPGGGSWCRMNHMDILHIRAPSSPRRRPHSQPRETSSAGIEAMSPESPSGERWLPAAGGQTSSLLVRLSSPFPLPSPHPDGLTLLVEVPLQSRGLCPPLSGKQGAHHGAGPDGPATPTVCWRGRGGSLRSSGDKCCILQVCRLHLVCGGEGEVEGSS